MAPIKTALSLYNIISFFFLEKGECYSVQMLGQLQFLAQEYMFYIFISCKEK